MSQVPVVGEAWVFGLDSVQSPKKRKYEISLGNEEYSDQREDHILVDFTISYFTLWWEGEYIFATKHMEVIKWLAM